MWLQIRFVATTIYVGKYYEKNTTTGTETFYYFLGNKLVAYLVESTVSSDMRYVHQDHLGSTSRTCPEPVERVTDDTGAAVYEASYDPWGNVSASTGTDDTDRLVESAPLGRGQRFDAAPGLTYYPDAIGTRYYDPTLARFISPDTIVPGVGDPQAWNRYAYVLGNPLRYVDPSGNDHLKTEIDSLVADITAAFESKNYVRGSALIVSKTLLSLRSRWHHSMLARFEGSRLKPVDGYSHLNDLEGGSVILVDRRVMAVEVLSPTALVVHSRDGNSTFAEVKQGRVPKGKDAWVPASGKIVTRGQPRDMTLRIATHESVHVDQRPDNPMGNAVFNLAHIPVPHAAVDLAQVWFDPVALELEAKTAMQETYWVVVP